MNITFKNELDPAFEVLGLLIQQSTAEWKDEIIRELDSINLDGHSFWEKHLKILEKYMDVFKEYKISLPQEKIFFEDMTETTFGLLAIMVIEHRRQVGRRELPDAQSLRSLLAFYMLDMNNENPDTHVKDQPVLTDDASIISFLEALSLKNNEKWFFMELLRTPDRYLNSLLDMIEANIPAYEKARAAVAKPLEKLLKNMLPREDSILQKIAGAWGYSQELYPTLAIPLLEIISYSNSYQGLFCQYLEPHLSGTSQEALLRQMKALADRSKLDILLELKKSHRYNLELAETLGLSPSTTSHHMTVLLTCGFVSVEKKDGKVYYCLQKEAISQFLSDMEQLLLL